MGCTLEYNSLEERLDLRAFKKFSQEFIAPISIIQNTLEMLSDDHFVSKKEKLSFIRSAINNLQRIRSTIEDIEAFVEINEGHLEIHREIIELEEDFHLPISEVISHWKERNITLNTRIDPDLILYSPKLWFKKSIGFLMDNACKFSPAGGEVVIALMANGIGGCVLMIRDEGTGIPIPQRDLVFQDYYQIAREASANYGGLVLQRKVR